MRVAHLVGEGDFLSAARLLERRMTSLAAGASAVPFDTLAVLCRSAAEHAGRARELATAAANRERAAAHARERIYDVLRARAVRVDFLSERTVEVVVQILGPFEVRVHGDRVANWGAQKNRTLLQYLILHPDRPVHREVLMELLWPGHSYASARNNLNVSLYGVRQAFAAAGRAGRYIVYRAGCYLLDPDVNWQVDQSRFLALVSTARANAHGGEGGKAITLYTQAVGTYRGDLFEDDPNCDWFAPVRRSLHELHLQVLEELADLQLGERDFGAASDTARCILAEDACRESAHRVLMRCYSQQHQQSLVARQFQLCIDALRQEFSLAPAEETVRLFRTLTATEAR